MKSKCGIRNSACSSAKAIFNNSNPPPALLLTIPAGAHFTFPLTRCRAILTLSSLSLSQQAGWMLEKADRGEQTWLDKPVILDHPPLPLPPPPNSLAPPSSSATPSLPLLSFYLLQPHIYPLPLLQSLLSPHASFLSLYHLWLGCRQGCSIGNSVGLEESSGAKHS